MSRKRKYVGIAETEVPAFVRHKKGVKDFLFGDNGLITADEKRWKERVGIIERIMKLVSSMESKKYKRRVTLGQAIRGRVR